MSDSLTPEQRSRNMSAIRSKDTKPEMLVRKLVHRMGYRFRLHCKDLPGKPDIVLPKHRKIILVHGCFWHGHGCKIGRMPQSKQEYWTPKINRNKHRDNENTLKLKNLGWDVLTLWECETRNLENVMDSLKAFLSNETSRIMRSRIP